MSESLTNKKISIYFKNLEDGVNNTYLIVNNIQNSMECRPEIAINAILEILHFKISVSACPQNTLGGLLHLRKLSFSKVIRIKIFLSCKHVIAAERSEHTILDVIRFQSSLDPVFCSELCTVKSRFVSVRRSRCRISGAISQSPGHFRKWGVSSNNILCCARMFLLHDYHDYHEFPDVLKFLQAFVFSGCERFIDANIF